MSEQTPITYAEQNAAELWTRTAANRRARAAAQIAELANAIALQAEAIATGTTTAGPHAVAQLMASNVELLVAWTTPGRAWVPTHMAEGQVIPGSWVEDEHAK